MSLKFRKSIQIFPGVKLNLSKSGLSLSLGPRGLKYTISTSGKSTATIGIPGSGLSYSKTLSKAFQTKKKSSGPIEHTEANEAQLIEYQNYVTYITHLHLYADEVLHWSAQGPSRLPEISADESSASHYVQLSTSAEDLSNLSGKVLLGDLDAYEQVLRAYLPLQDLAEFGSGFDIAFIDAKKAVVYFDLNLKDVIPQEKLSLTPTGKLSRKALPKGEQKSIADDYIASAALRVALDLLALLPLNLVQVVARDNAISPITGHDTQTVYLDVAIDKKTLASLNLETIDPSSALQNFSITTSLLKR